MIFIVVVTAVILTGVSILLLLDISQKNIAVDIALGWFIGSGYYALTCAFLSLGADAQGRAVSIAILSLPIILAFKRMKLYLGPSVDETARTIKQMSKLESALFILAGMTPLILFALHGASTPTIADDSLKLRSYIALLSQGYPYDNASVYEDLYVRNIFYAGLWPTFLPHAFWDIAGNLEQFYLNYMNIATALFFMMLVITVPLSRGGTKEALYSFLFAGTMPLFLVHITTTLNDLPFICFTVGSVIMYGQYVRKREYASLYVSILLLSFLTIIKDKGEYIFFPFIFIYFIHEIYKYTTEKIKTPVKVILFILPILVIIGFKKYELSRFQIQTPGYIGSTVALSKPEATGDIWSIQKPEEGRTSAFMIKSRLFGYSLFSSGNFGLIFWILAATILFRGKSIFDRGNIWLTILFSILFMEIFINSVVRYKDVDALSDVMHRANMLLAVLTAFYVPYIWFDEKQR